MKLAIMQPYFFPYVGYYQLMNAVDEFVVYDNIEFTKKGWINRNRILVNGAPDYISLPLKKDSDYLNINERYLSEMWIVNRKKILNRIAECYRKAPFYEEAFPLVEECLWYDDTSLFNFIFNSLSKTKAFLGIKTKLILSSTVVGVDNNLKAQEKILSICAAQGAKTYINSIGGMQLYDTDVFKERGVVLKFLQANPIVYNQYNNDFVPWLSIIDIIMFCSKQQIMSSLINKYTLI